MIIEEDIKRIYNSKKDDYQKLGEIILDELKLVQKKQKELNIDYIQFRIKDFDSFYEKIGKNKDKWKDKDPFVENEDFCGLRIVHLLNQNLNDILIILRDKFDVFREENPTEYRPISPKEFTYRSYHAFAKLKGDLLLKNSSLNGLFAEIQIRTICMHSWAAIEHKLNYKEQDKFPKDYRPVINRKFSQMSAVLEIADEFFVSLKEEKNRIIAGYKTKLSKADTKEIILDTLNIDSLQAYLDDKFPNFLKEPDRVRYFMTEMLDTNLKLRNIEDGVKLLKEKGLYTKLTTEYPTDKPTQSGIGRLILDITNTAFYELRKEKLGKSKWMNFVNIIKRQMNF